ncbi:hypothetical protein NAPIS_ORF02693 [Vairimorpha apis BRL 01]|uniref:Uncharacterized protein n=1 Tax=Vairimorpha apis BRL 01 TaxID=1037528 RepID=T0L4P1_9MICR|nr:hypothetical protein NAPIS_ORF02693 [Vairimorpha apis BRL 01]
MLGFIYFIYILFKVIYASKIKDVNNKCNNEKYKNDKFVESENILLEKRKNYQYKVNLNVVMVNPSAKNKKSRLNIDNKNLELNTFSKEHIGIIDDYDELLYLNKKFKYIEHIPSICDIISNNLFLNKIYFDYTVLDFGTTLKHLRITESFKYVVKIIENDLINTLKASINMAIIKNEYIMPIILNLENRQLDEQKILYTIIITNEILNIDINKRFKHDNKQILLERILSTNFF